MRCRPAEGEVTIVIIIVSILYTGTVPYCVSPSFGKVFEITRLSAIDVGSWKLFEFRNLLH